MSGLEPAVDILREAARIDRGQGLERSAKDYERAAKILELYAAFDPPKEMQHDG